MKKQWILALSFMVGILVALTAPMLVLFTGVIDMGADVNPGFIEQTLAPWALDRSVETRASKMKNPFASDLATVAAGLAHYRENCVMCHGAPDIKRSGFAKGFNPPAPTLNLEDDTPDSELFWFIKHGIRMTAMPAFGLTLNDDEIWKTVAFIRHLPDLTDQEKNSLRNGSGGALKQEAP